MFVLASMVRHRATPVVAALAVILTVPASSQAGGASGDAGVVQGGLILPPTSENVAAASTPTGVDMTPRERDRVAAMNALMIDVLRVVHGFYSGANPYLIGLALTKIMYDVDRLLGP
jgi:hypothetical protein